MYNKRTIYKNGNSRSANAEYAESEGRFPLTRASKVLGISTKLFREAIVHIQYTTNEWHHVSKYANRVDYYDTIAIGECPQFWLFCSKKSRKNKVEFKAIASKLQFEILLERLKPQTIVKTHCFSSDLKVRCEKLKIPYNALFDAISKDESLKGKTQVVKNGTYESENYNVNYNGSITYVGRYSTMSNCKHIIPFDLTVENIRNVFKTKAKGNSWNRYQSEYHWILNKYVLCKGIVNLKNGKNFLDHNSFSCKNQSNHNAKNRIINKHNNQYQLVA